MTDQPLTILIRPATEADIAAVSEIYGYYVSHTTISFETEPPTTSVMTRRYEEVISNGAPYLVATRDDEVIGFAYAGPYKSRAAYRHTVEHSVYLAASESGRGVGRLLLERLIEACTEGGFTEMIATIAGDDNHASIRLHERCAFVPAGKLTNVGFKQDRWLDITLMRRSLR